VEGMSVGLRAIISRELRVLGTPLVKCSRRQQVH
jgi:hypothetical protein